ncbi:MAG: hypothetical protein Q9165_001120 [Trypethelium subeluteriae]
MPYIRNFHRLIGQFPDRKTKLYLKNCLDFIEIYAGERDIHPEDLWLAGKVRVLGGYESNASTAHLRGPNGLVGRNVDYTRLSDAVAITKEWVDKCSNYHVHCGGHLQPSILPARLVSIDGTKLSLAETKPGQTGHYLALSYCWGEASRQMLKLKSFNHAVLQCNIDWSKLVLTHQQAIQFAREAGYRYIWIDALCIMQDSPDDWAQQAPLVPNIYGNADLTLVAGRSDDARNGFFLPNPVPDTPPVRLTYDMSEMITSHCWISLERSRDIGPTSDRGWCYQEALMSRRLVMFGMQQLSFRCHECQMFEDGDVVSVGDTKAWFNHTFNAGFFRHEPIDNSSPGQDIKNFYQPIRYIDSIESALGHAGPLNAVTILEHWYTIVMEYSQRGFYDPRDIHAALSGAALFIQKAIAKHMEHGTERYMAGLWEMDMVRGLLWTGSRLQDARLQALKPATLREGRAVRRAPSWSWMALEGPIEYQMSRGAPRCKPACLDGRTWSSQPDSWGPLLVGHKNWPGIFKLEIRAYFREVRGSQLNTKVVGPPAYYPRHLEGPDNSDFYGIFNHGHLFEATEKEPIRDIDSIPRSELDSHIAAIGVFDQGFAPLSRLIMTENGECEIETRLWALRITEYMGLILVQAQGSDREPVLYKRVGHFYIWTNQGFYQKGFFNESSYEPLEDRLPMETIILV